MILTASLYDPITSEEGAIDPLGMASIADRLAGRLVPGVRERMKHPRFLTAIAAGAHICKNFRDQTCKDGETKPNIVFEWHVIQALYKVYKDDSDQLMGMAGKLKAQQAWQKGESLSRSRYLKNAYTFGFHGIYRTLSEDLDIAPDDELGEQGDALLRVWEEEQNLPGFLSGESGKGNEICQKLIKAVSYGLDEGEAYAWNWKVFDEIAPLFAPRKAGPVERDLILSMLKSDSEGYRRAVLESVPLYFNDDIEFEGERGFHDLILQQGHAGLTDLLQAIQSYETFCRILYNTFYKILFHLSERNRRVTLEELQDDIRMIEDVGTFRDLYNQVEQRLRDFQESLAFEQLFGEFGMIQTSSDIIKLVIDHHVKVQKKKPPNGKLPWLETLTDGSFMIRPAYRESPWELSADAYVNTYRMFSMRNFYDDLIS